MITINQISIKIINKNENNFWFNSLIIYLLDEYNFLLNNKLETITN